MNDITITDPCILFALEREAHAFLQEFRPQQRFPGAPCWARFCGPEWLTVLVLQTGVGTDKTRKALDWVLNKPKLGNLPYEPKVILSAGYAGALTDNLQVGDLVLATEVVDAGGNCCPVTWPGDLPPGDWKPPLRRGRLLTTSLFVSKPEEKQSLAGRHQALAVDMESAAFAELCGRNEIPFGCLRAISDAVNTPISVQVMTLVEDASISWLGLTKLLARSPGKIRELRLLARATRISSRNLAAALGELLTLTLSWGSEL